MCEFTMKISTRNEGVEIKDRTLVSKTYEFGGKERSLLEMLNLGGSKLLHIRPSASFKIHNFILDLAGRGELNLEKEILLDLA